MILLLLNEKYYLKLSTYKGLPHFAVLSCFVIVKDVNYWVTKYVVVNKWSKKVMGSPHIDSNHEYESQPYELPCFVQFLRPGNLL